MLAIILHNIPEGIATFISTTPLIVMGIGSVSFMISDYILTLDRFVIPKRKTAMEITLL